MVHLLRALCMNHRFSELQFRNIFVKTTTGICMSRVSLKSKLRVQRKLMQCSGKVHHCKVSSIRLLSNWWNSIVSLLHVHSCPYSSTAKYLWVFIPLQVKRDVVWQALSWTCSPVAAIACSRWNWFKHRSIQTGKAFFWYCLLLFGMRRSTFPNLWIWERAVSNARSIDTDSLVWELRVRKTMGLFGPRKFLASQKILGERKTDENERNKESACFFGENASVQFWTARLEISLLANYTLPWLFNYIVNYAFVVFAWI